MTRLIQKRQQSKRSRKSFSLKPASISKKDTPMDGKPTFTKAWGGRFARGTHHLVERFTSSLAIDQRLYHHDIQGSIAHCKTLQRAKVLTSHECVKLIRGLEKIRGEISRGQHVFKEEDEDIHMSIERRLIQIIGPLGGKLHTGRSRNDQVSLDLRLYLRDTLDTVSNAVTGLQQSLIFQARKHQSLVMPGYTHLQRAQPVLFAHHLLAYYDMLERDKDRMRDTHRRLNVMPLGSGALAGTNYPLDRLYTAKLLNFPAVTTNSLDAVSDRDFVVEVLSSLSLLMMHLSRLSEELILWSSQEFQFVELPDSFCTGSSMMPQKKNPDVAELIRGKSGRVFGHLLAVLTTLKGLPLSYNRDLQEDKEALFDALDTVLASVEIYAILIKQLKVHRETMAKAAQSGLLLATELADYLVQKGIPFRESHGIIGRLVRDFSKCQKDLSEATVNELRSYSPRFGPDALTWLRPEGAVDRKNQIGGTAGKQVERRLKALEKNLHTSA
jgi:argininosuccinate lyase